METIGVGLILYSNILGETPCTLSMLASPQLELQPRPPLPNNILANHPPPHQPPLLQPLFHLEHSSENNPVVVKNGSH